MPTGKKTKKKTKSKSTKHASPRASRKITHAYSRQKERLLLRLGYEPRVGPNGVAVWARR